MPPISITRERIRRSLDGNHSYRKVLLLCVILGGIIVYFVPTLVQWVFSATDDSIEAFEDHCLQERLTPFLPDVADYNANILYNPSTASDRPYLPYIGNGYFGIPVSPEGWLYIKRGRSLTVPVQWQPLISSKTDHREATVTHFIKGMVFKYMCAKQYYMEFIYYAHRGWDGLLVQDVKIVNPFAVPREVQLKPQIENYWGNARVEAIKIQVDGLFYDYNLISGFVSLPDTKKIIAISIIYKTPPKVLQIKPRSTLKLQFLTTLKYSQLIKMEEYHSEHEATKKRAIEAMKKAIQAQRQGLKDEHVSLWQSYWHTGFTISDSKASGAINGHKINSTLYHVLSQVPRGIPDIEKSVTMNEGCYRGHHTLDAPKLWKDTSSIDGVNDIVEAWLITLEKQGCHHLMTGGPPAVQQAIVLSLGGLRFSNQHLEFNIDPQYLHRDYLFRRISYGNVTHLNISVTVGEDNRALLGVALDKSDSVYFGCDAGCLDAPVSLSQAYTNFPVKLTKPLTAILYITSDHQHMQELRNALHVHAVDDAPAHDHVVMALHKHGHQLGGLPTLFWVSICFLIIVFHLFLCKLIVNEYYGHQDRQKVRYSKL